jgi:hypothetical protein
MTLQQHALKCNNLNNIDRRSLELQKEQIIGVMLKINITANLFHSSGRHEVYGDFCTDISRLHGRNVQPLLVL